ncbi:MULTISPECIES: hypothetical protein [Shewanella]|uniref:hypothetical protein n=1 Tax=Shewanella TaxID=22 RepID=UPI00244A8850|nr:MULTISPECIES: hypothetical protein [Shewanella]MDH0451101.1 hypothetical protein [Shewanella sp. GD04112]
MKTVIHRVENLLKEKQTVNNRIQVAIDIRAISKSLLREGTTPTYQLFSELFSSVNPFMCKASYHRYVTIGLVADTLQGSCHFTTFNGVYEIAKIVGSDRDKLIKVLTAAQSKSPIVVTDKQILAELKSLNTGSTIEVVSQFQSRIDEFCSGMSNVIKHSSECTNHFIVDFNSEIAKTILSHEKDSGDINWLNNSSSIFWSLLHHSSVLTNKKNLFAAQKITDLYNDCTGDSFTADLSLIWNRFFTILMTESGNDKFAALRTPSEGQMVSKYMSMIEYTKANPAIKIAMARLS